jgi:hypothetical protein
LPEAIKAEDLIALIRRKYPISRPDGLQSHVALEQVPDGTGMFQGRWIDVVVFSLWSSKGLIRAAFEVKVSRSDFLRELQNPLKYKWALECFHEFWFVAPQNVIQLPELPPNIGWMFPRGGKLAIKRHAVQNPNPRLDDILLAAFMRAAAKEINRVSRTSEEYRIANIYKDAVTTFLNQRNVKKYRDPSTREELLEWLGEATMDNQLKEDRDHLLDIATRFQRNVASLFSIFAVIAGRSLLARDELGNHIVQAFGGDDKESIKALQDYAKAPKAIESQKDYAQLVEIIMNLGKGES